MPQIALNAHSLNVMLTCVQTVESALNSDVIWSKYDCSLNIFRGWMAKRMRDRVKFSVLHPRIILHLQSTFSIDGGISPLLSFHRSRLPG